MPVLPILFCTIVHVCHYCSMKKSSSSSSSSSSGGGGHCRRRRRHHPSHPLPSYALVRTSAIACINKRFATFFNTDMPTFRDKHSTAKLTSVDV